MYLFLLVHSQVWQSLYPPIVECDSWLNVTQDTKKICNLHKLYKGRLRVSRTGLCIVQISGWWLHSHQISLISMLTFSQGYCHPYDLLILPYFLVHHGSSFQTFSTNHRGDTFQKYIQHFPFLLWWFCFPMVTHQDYFRLCKSKILYFWLT